MFAGREKHDSDGKVGAERAAFVHADVSRILCALFLFEILEMPFSDGQHVCVCACVQFIRTRMENRGGRINRDGNHRDYIVETSRLYRASNQSRSIDRPFVCLANWQSVGPLKKQRNKISCSGEAARSPLQNQDPRY